MGCCESYKLGEKNEITESSSSQHESPLSSLSLIQKNLYSPEKKYQVPSSYDLERYKIEKETYIKNIFRIEIKKFQI